MGPQQGRSLGPGPAQTRRLPGQEGHPLRVGFQALKELPAPQQLEIGEHLPVVGGPEQPLQGLQARPGDMGAVRGGEADSGRSSHGGRRWPLFPLPPGPGGPSPSELPSVGTLTPAALGCSAPAPHPQWQPPIGLIPAPGMQPRTWFPLGSRGAGRQAGLHLTCRGRGAPPPGCPSGGQRGCPPCPAQTGSAAG